MPLRMEIKRLLSKGTDRVKSVDIHPTETWLLVSLYNGQVHIWNYKTESLVKSFEVSQQPVRCAKFIPRKQWIVAGADDLAVRVYNYNTMAKVKTFEAHNDYIRFLAIHPTQPLMLSSSDDMTIRLWNWEKNWQCMQTYEGHNHFVMMVTFNPKDPNTFASASLDRTIKVWGLGTSTAHFTLEGHDQGVNCVDYYTGGDKPYIVSGADDRLVKIWDYQNKTCVQTLDGHTHNVSVVAYHPSLPIIISGSEDTTVRIWNANTYRLEKSLNYGMDRVWALTCLKGSNKVAIGYDNGLSLIKLGREEPAVSMANNGKIIWAKNNEIQQLDIKTAAEITDGERLALPTKELGTSEVFPQKLEHSSNGRFVVVCGDGEFTIFTSLAWRNKTFGTGVEFVWGVDTGEYAVRETNGKVKTYKNFKEHKTLRPSYNTEGIFGGLALGVRSPSFVCFYDWEELRIIRRIDVSPKAIYWNESGELLTIASESSFYILKYNRQAVQAAFDQSSEVSPDGIDDAFEVIQDFPERVRTGIWVGDCFIYTNSANRLNYCVGNEIVTIGHLDRVMYLLGYVAKQSRVYLTDKSLNVVSYRLDISIVNYQTAILRGDLGLAAKIFPEIPVDQRNRIAQFLESQGHKEQALEIATDPDLKFDLAIQLGHLDIAVSIARENDSEQKWRQLSDLSISKNRYDLAEVCLQQAQDLSGLLLLYTSFGDSTKVRELAEQAQAQSRNNISFMCYFLLNDLDKCIDLLCQTARIPEAAFMARTYLPSRVSEVVSLWKDNLKTVNLKAANSLADPDQYPNLFDNFELALKAERLFRKYAPVAASSYESWKGSLLRDLIADARDREEVNEEEESVAIKAVPVPAPEPVAVAVAVEPKEVKVEAPVAAKVEAEAEPEIDIDLVDATEKQVQELLEQEGGAEDEIVVDF